MRAARLHGEDVIRWGLYYPRAYAQGRRGKHSFSLDPALLWLLLAILGGIVGNAAYDFVRAGIARFGKLAKKDQRRYENILPDLDGLYMVAYLLQVAQSELFWEKVKQINRRHAKRIALPQRPQIFSTRPRGIPQLPLPTGEVAKWFDDAFASIEKTRRLKDEPKTAIITELETLYREQGVWSHSLAETQTDFQVIEEIGRDLRILKRGIDDVTSRKKRSDVEKRILVLQECRQGLIEMLLERNISLLRANLSSLPKNAGLRRLIATLFDGRDA